MKGGVWDIPRAKGPRNRPLKKLEKQGVSTPRPGGEPRVEGRSLPLKIAFGAHPLWSGGRRPSRVRLGVGGPLRGFPGFAVPNPSLGPGGGGRKKRLPIGPRPRPPGLPFPSVRGHGIGFPHTPIGGEDLPPHFGGLVALDRREVWPIDGEGPPERQIYRFARFPPPLWSPGSTPNPPPSHSGNAVFGKFKKARAKQSARALRRGLLALARGRTFTRGGLFGGGAPYGRAPGGGGNGMAWGGRKTRSPQTSCSRKAVGALRALMRTTVRRPGRTGKALNRVH